MRSDFSLDSIIVYYYYCTVLYCIIPYQLCTTTQGDKGLDAFSFFFRHYYYRILLLLNTVVL